MQSLATVGIILPHNARLVGRMQRTIMGNSRLKEMLVRAGKNMASDLDQRLIPHNGEQGASREEIVRAFLRAYLPKRFEVSTGFIFDADGRVSEQIDIIIADALVAPRFDAPGGTRFYPCEAVVAAGEVKTAVTSRRQLWDAIFPSTIGFLT